MDKTRDSTNSKIWPDSTCAISVRRKGQILLVVESLVLSTTSVVQCVGEANGNFLALLREEARYCDFQRLQTVTNPEEDLLKNTSGLREPEAKLRLMEGIKTKSTMTISKMTESLLFRSQALVFAISSIGKKPVRVKQDV